MSIPPDRSEVVRLTTILEALVQEVSNLSGKVEELKDEHVFYLEHRLVVLEERLDSTNARLKKIEDHATKLFWVMVTEGLTLAAGIALWAINKYTI